MGTLQKKAFDIIDTRREEMLAMWKKLVDMESGTLHKDDVDKAACFLKELGEASGGRARIVEFKDAGNGLILEFGNPTARPHVCFLGHFDTVFPHGAATERPFRIEGDRAFGPGVLDMKGGVVIQLHAARALIEAGYSERLIRVVLAGDEECMHAKSDMPRTFEEECRGAVAAFNFETGDVADTLVVGRKGTVAYDIATRGVSVHAGREPEKGRSAILEMAHKIIAVQALTDYGRGITFNVGTVKGGVVRNAVPDYAEAGIDVRVAENDQLAWVDEKIADIVGRTFVEGTTTTCVRTPGMAPMPREGNEKLFGFVRKVSEDLGFGSPEAIVSGGGSDSAYSVEVGVPTVDQMGVRGQWNHSDREYALVDSLFERTRLAVACVLRLDEFERGV